MNFPMIQAVNGVIEKDHTKILSRVSRHVPAPYVNRKEGCLELMKIMKEQINLGVIKETDYIISIGYKEGDFQIGLSGSPYKCEKSFEKAMHRELGEEIGLKLKPREKNPISFSKNIINGSTQIYGISMDNILPLTKKDINNYSSENKDKRFIDDKQRKVGMIVFGDKELVLKTMIKIKNFYPSKDKADKIVAFNVLDAINWLIFISKTMNLFTFYESFPSDIQKFYDPKRKRYCLPRKVVISCKTIIKEQPLKSAIRSML